MLKIIAVIVLVLVIALAGTAYFLGIFNPVSIEKAVAGPYTIACLDHIGPYKNICSKIKNAKKLLDGQQITPIAACGIYYDNPKTVASDKLRSRGGFIIEDNSKLEILEKLAIPSREVVIATVKAHPAIAAMKTYPAIQKWLAANNSSISGPCLEIYYSSGIVETQVPITTTK